MRSYYDIIIIGAGPAGLNCANILSSSNLSVLILEKNSIIGPKTCAGGLTPKFFQLSNLPKTLTRRFECVDFYINNKKIKLKTKLYTIDRNKLASWQLKKIIKSKNIHIKTNTYVSKINNKYIFADNKKIAYKYLIGADGSNSNVRRYLKLPTQNIHIGFQFKLYKSNLTRACIYYDDKLFSSFYSWIFPHNKYVSIGCGFNPQTDSFITIFNNFKKWLNTNKIIFNKKSFEIFPINYDFQGFCFNNIFLLGDAAGLSSPLTGEGIFPALLSAQEVALTILNKKHNPYKLNRWLQIKNKHSSILHKITRANKYRGLLYNLSYYLFKLKYFQNKLIELFFLFNK